MNEVYAFDTFHTGSMRNVYSPNVCVPQELITDQIAKALGQDPYKFRQAFLKDARSRAVLDKAAQVGNWGRAMPAGTAQGIAFHKEYKGVSAALVEIDCRPATVNRVVPDAYTGPRVTKVVFVVDVGLPINPRGIEAQMMGGIMDGIAMALTSSLHLTNGYFLEGSWDNYYYTRQWNVPPELEIVVLPSTTGTPGGAGEFGVAPTMAAVACAYARATGTMPTVFPINHDKPLGFTPLPTVPPIPQSPTDGLSNTSRSPFVPTHTFVLNGETVSVDCADDVRLLWVLRDLLNVHGPKYGCGLEVCKACTCHINGKAFGPCSVMVKDIKATDEITTIEGLPATVGKPLHPMQEAWLDEDVPQCGYCQPGQIMAAVALVKEKGTTSPTPTSRGCATSAGAAPTSASARRSRPAPRTCNSPPAPRGDPAPPRPQWILRPR